MIAEQLPLLSHDLPPLNLHDRVRTPEGCFSTIHRVGRVATRAGARCVHCWHCFSTIHRVGRVATTIVRSRPDEAIGVSVPSTESVGLQPPDVSVPSTESVGLQPYPNMSS